MNQIISRIGVKAAYEMALTLYPEREAAVQAVADQLCMSVEAVEEALQPLTLHE
jgi:hypothetical protein